MRRGSFEGKGASCGEVVERSAVTRAKMAEPVEMPFGMWTRLGPRNHVFDGAHWRHLANTVEPSVFGSDAALYQITLTTTTHTERPGSELPSVEADVYV